MPATLHAILADITTLDVDAIVNAANGSLLGGGGVDGVIHRAAGPELLQACRGLHGCDVGDAKITPGYRLRARHVIHTVGPRWAGGGHGEASQLGACYRRCLEIAQSQGLLSIAFPCISTGVYGYPSDRAAVVAVAAVREALAQRHGSLTEVWFCCYAAGDLARYEALLARQAP